MGFDQKGDLTRLYIKFDDAAAPILRKSVDKIGAQWSMKKGIQRLEQILKREQGWKWAYVQESATQTILHYYHSSSGLERLQKAKYVEILRANAQVQARAYLVYSLEAKQSDPNKVKGKSIAIYQDLDIFLARISEIWSSDLLKIQIYQEKSLLCEYNPHRGLQWKTLLR